MFADSVIFDLDGTLWDSCRSVAESWSRTLAEDHGGLLQLSEADIQGIMGMTAEQIAAKLFTVYGDQALEICLDCLKKECEYISNHGGKLYPGVGQLFQLLSPTVGLYIVSNCQDGYIQCFGRYTGLERYICDFECSGVTGLSKGENIRLIARRNFLRSPIYVGDTAMDEESARSAGVPFIHAAYGFGQALAPDAVIHNPLELLDIIEV